MADESNSDNGRTDEGSSPSSSAPRVVMVVLAIVFLFLAASPDRPTTTPVVPLPTRIALPSPSPTITLVPVSAVSAPTYFGCQPGIEVGKTIDVVYTSVRMRRSWGYLGKNDVQDTVHYLKTGDKVRVIDGPTMADGVCWWKLEHAGFQGWTADHSGDGSILLWAGQ